MIEFNKEADRAMEAETSGRTTDRLWRVTASVADITPQVQAVVSTHIHMSVQSDIY